MNPYLLGYIIFVALLLSIWYWTKNNNKNNNNTGAVNEEIIKTQEWQNKSEEGQTDDYEEDDDTEPSGATSYAQGDLTEDRTVIPEKDEEQENSGQIINQQKDTAIVIFRHQPRSNTWICDNCETMNNDDFPYCFVCGTPKN